MTLFTHVIYPYGLRRPALDTSNGLFPPGPPGLHRPTDVLSTG